MNIRRAEARDAETIASFNEAMAAETEDKPLDPTIIRRGVARLMERPHYGFYLVAENTAGVPVGCLMITFEWSDWRDGLFWWIQSVYVAPAARRQGVYTALYDQARELAADDPDVIGFRLYVETENIRAQATYEKLGMQRCPYHLYEALGPASEV